MLSRSMRRSVRAPRSLGLLALVFLVSTAAAFLGLSASGKNFSSSTTPPNETDGKTGDVANPEKPSFTGQPVPAVATGAPTPLQEESHTEIAATVALKQKLDTDTNRLSYFQKQRRQLLSDQQQFSTSSQAQDFSPEHKTRQDLVEELVLLLNLEKKDQSESSEIIAVRHKIARLQAELSQGDAAAPPQSKGGLQVDQTELVKIRGQIAQCEAEILADQQELARQTRTVQPNGNTLEATSANHHPPQVPLTSYHAAVASKSAAPNAFHLEITRTVWISVVSLLLGCAISTITLLWISRSNGLISDAAELQEMLAGKAFFVGTIPRMKVR